METPVASESANPTSVLAVDSLILEGSPRIEGENVMHTRVLAEVRDRLPPIFVHRATRRVIDGVHRLQAAKLRGETTIEAILFEGDLESAFVHAVRTNITHGLPLSLADRQAAAKRIIAFYPAWSDRAVAAAVGLAPATIGGIRARIKGEDWAVHARLGRDGRVRPLNLADGRRRAAEVIADRPGASLREIALAAGISVGTARDVRRRIQNGEDPVPTRSRENGLANTQGGGSERDAEPVRGAGTGRTPSTLLASLRRDPTLRYSERGRDVIRRLSAHLVDADELSRIVDDLPSHCAYTVCELTYAYAEAWRVVSNQLQAKLSAESPINR